MLLGLVLFCSIWGIDGILWAMVLSNINIYMVNAFLAGRYVGLKMTKQLAAVLPGIAIASFSITIAYGLGSLHNINPWLEAAFFILMFIGLSFIFRLHALRVLSHAVVSRATKIKNKNESR